MARVTFVKGQKWTRLEHNLANPEKALKAIGLVMVSESQRSFTEQKFGDATWPERAPVNVFGLIRDFSLGRTEPMQRRFERRPALQDTGRLAQSIASRVVGTNTVEVGTNVEYAMVHQVGGQTQSEPMTSAVRRAIWHWLQKQSTVLKRQVGWVLNKKFVDKRITQNVPARPFLGITDRTRTAVRSILGIEIMEAK